MKKAKGTPEQLVTSSTLRMVPCPTCGKPSVYSQLNAVRPFCSEVCQTGDLAAWASDEYAIPTKEPLESVKDELTDQDLFE
jgi:endogenous inhibitor of DNA gyrase (YacG/DUF329 family)